MANFLINFSSNLCSAFTEIGLGIHGFFGDSNVPNINASTSIVIFIILIALVIFIVGIF